MKNSAVTLAASTVQFDEIAADVYELSSPNEVKKVKEREAQQRVIDVG